MKVKTRLLCAFVSFTLISAALMSGCGGSSKKTKLYFDGGGGSGNYTTTSKYDTLETLAKEWNRNNDEFEVVINKSSLNGNRSAITSMLSATTAPDMLMQVGTVVNDDIGNGWYVELNEYLDKPNPYEEGNERWRDIYGDSAIAYTRASDDKNYYVCLDNIAVGMIYNMDILNAAGVSEAPETYSEFFECLETLKKAKEQGKISADIYLPSGLWHESYIGTSVYGDKIREWDADHSGTVSTYELIAAYKAGEWSLGDEHFGEYLRLLGEKSQYYPKNYLAYDVLYKFAKGNLAVTDAVGNTMNTLASNARFNVEITGYPVLDNAVSEYGGYTVVRGSAGLSSAYWVTNSAIAKGQAAVDACVDFLMYLTASENNARLVNDLGYALPLDVTKSNVELFSEIKEQYIEDSADENAVMWSACFIPDQLGTDFNNYYQLAMGDFYEDSDGVKTGDAQAVISALNAKIDACVNDIIARYGWTFSE